MRTKFFSKDSRVDSSHNSPKQPQLASFPRSAKITSKYMVRTTRKARVNLSMILFFPVTLSRSIEPSNHSKPIKNLATNGESDQGKMPKSTKVYSNNSTGNNLAQAEKRNNIPKRAEIKQARNSFFIFGYKKGANQRKAPSLEKSNWIISTRK